MPNGSGLFVVVRHVTHFGEYDECSDCEVQGPFSTKDEACKALSDIYEDAVRTYERLATSACHEYEGDVMYSANDGESATISLTNASATDLYVCEIGSQPVSSPSGESLSESGRYSVNGELAEC